MLWGFFMFYSLPLLWVNFLQEAVSVTPLIHQVEDEADVNTNTTCELAIEVDIA